MTVMFLAEKWSRVKDSMSALNCQLASSVAKDRPHETCCVVLEASDAERKEAADCGVDLILPSIREVVLKRYKDEKPKTDWFLSPETFFANLTKIQNVKYIVEHVQSSTQLLVAKVFRDRHPHFKDAKIVLINHAISSGNKHIVKFAALASAVFSVGPHVFEHFKTLYHRTGIRVRHELYLPRPEKAFFDLNVDQREKTVDPKRMLTVITDDDVESSRYVTLAAELGRMSNEYKNMHIKVPLWSVCTLSEADHATSKTFLTKHLNYPHIVPQMHTYALNSSSEDGFYRLLKQSDVCVVPPDEPFRMEGLRSIAAGLPVVVPSHAPLARFLETCFGPSGEYFMYDPLVDGDLFSQICKMLNKKETPARVTRIKNELLHHRGITESHLKFRACFSEVRRAQPGQIAAHVPLTDEGVGSFEDASSSKSQSPQPYRLGNPEFSAVLSMRETPQRLRRKRPYKPTLVYDANLEIEEKKMKMEMEKMRAEIDQKRKELAEEHKKMKEELKEREKEMEIEMETLRQKNRERQIKMKQKEIVLKEISDLYEIRKDKVIARDDPELIEQLDDTYDRYKARLDRVDFCGSWF